MNEHNFNLLAILQVLKSKMRTLFGVTLGVMVLVAIIYLIKPKKYEATTEFYTVNPMYNDRANIFKQNQNLVVDVFGNENIVDKVMSMCKSDAIIYALAQKFDLYTHYKLDSTNPKEVNKLLQLFRDNRNIKRTEYYTIEASFKDKDPEMAAKISNEIARESTRQFATFLFSLNQNVIKALKEKSTQLDNHIVAYTDSLAKMRSEYGIYEILSPNRKNTIINGRVTGKGDVGFGMEVIQNVESIKDQMVNDRANYESVINEYAALSGGKEADILHQLYPALPPVKPAGLGFILTVLAAGLATAFFLLLYFLLKHFLSIEASRK